MAKNKAVYNTVNFRLTPKMHPKFSDNIVMMLSANLLPYYAEFATFMNFHKTESIPTCGVNVSNKGMNFYWNQKFVDSLTDTESLFLLLHEEFHLLFDHSKRSISYNKELSNIVQDMIINQIIHDDVLLRINTNNKVFIDVPKNHEEFLTDEDGKSIIGQDGKPIKNPFFNQNSALFIPKDYKGEAIFENLYQWVKDQHYEYKKRIEKLEDKKQQQQQKQQQQNAKNNQGKGQQQKEDDQQDQGNQGKPDPNSKGQDNQDNQDQNGQGNQQDPNNKGQGNQGEQESDGGDGNQPQDQQGNGQPQPSDNQGDGDQDGQGQGSPSDGDGNQDGQGQGQGQGSPSDGDGNQDGQGQGQGSPSDGGSQGGQGQGNAQCTANGDEMDNGGDGSVKDSFGNPRYGDYGQNNVECSSLDSLFDSMEKGNKNLTLDSHISDDVQQNARKSLVNDFQQKLKNRGLMSSEVEAVLNKLKKSKKNYLKEIKRTVSSHIIGTTKHKSITRPNRRGIEGIKGKKKYKNVINVILDTSGSMGNDFEKVLSYIFQNDIHINLIQIDTEVKVVEDIKNKRDLEKMKIRGLGGTVLQPAINFVSNPINKLYKYNNVILTDGYTDHLDFTNILGKSLILTTGVAPVTTDPKGKVKCIVVDRDNSIYG